MSTEISTITDEEAAGFGGMMSMAPTAGLAIQMAGAVLEKQVATAKAWPRSVALFKKKTAALLSEDIETAKSAEYAKPQFGAPDGKVRGASIRLAELAALCWTNIKLELGAIEVGDKSVNVTVTAWDMEANYVAFGLSSTSILKKDGTRMSPSVVENLTMATASKARRNAILSIIPKSYMTDLLKTAKMVVDKQKPPLNESRKKALDYFETKFGVKVDAICNHLQVAGIADITEDHLDVLRAMGNAINDGEAKVEEFFPSASSGGASAASDKVKQHLEEKRAAATVAEPEKAPEATNTGPQDDKTIFLGLWAEFLKAGGNPEDILQGAFTDENDIVTKCNKAALQKKIRFIGDQIAKLRK